MPVAMETESLDDQDLASITASNINNQSSGQGTSWKGRKHSFFQVFSVIGFL